MRRPNVTLNRLWTCKYICYSTNKDWWTIAWPDSIASAKMRCAGQRSNQCPVWSERSYYLCGNMHWKTAENVFKQCSMVSYYLPFNSFISVNEVSLFCSTIIYCMTVSISRSRSYNRQQSGRGAIDPPIGFMPLPGPDSLDTRRSTVLLPALVMSLRPLLPCECPALILLIVV